MSSLDQRVAVVILNWNGAAHLRQFLPSVVTHTPAWVDIIVADNGSTDESRQVIEEEFTPRVELISLSENYGFAEGYNQTLKGLKHDIFILLNSDVEVSERWVEPLLEEFAAAEDIAVVGSKIRSYTHPEMFEYAGAAGGFIDYLGYPFCRGRILSHCEVDGGEYDTPRDLFWVSGAAFAIRASKFQESSGFDGDLFAHMEEIDLCWRLQLLGYRVRIAPQSVVYHLGGGTLAVNSPRKVMLNHRNNLAMLYKCAPTRQRIVVAILRPALDILAAVSYLLSGSAQSAAAVAKAWWEFIKWHKMLSLKRKMIRSNVVKESQYIYRGSILLRYIMGSRKIEI